ncbi:DHA2 family efflux MFS transporter permease subunit [Salinisphaera hydrothermalis]|uniref:EmrB/QacA family drug resistance transporter n=1 Tax=Salinisphaera hydrothermalis (strain C41B8) TaxID=1304275 RepID=A0A084IKF4_SALHC|nr:DHA2 family efflux MFS transporter permease subunit [Salinisphaera hydrothermalis]KEZ77188.1 EmrB/QacA family drug resistance transporter [Salinisphaera hydrothermalis C41B8]
MSDTTANGNPAAIAGQAEYPAGRWLIAAVVGLAAFMEVLDISIANVSLSHIAGSLSASQDEATWILTAYLVSNAIVLPISGWLSQVMGRKRFFITSIVAFSIASLACGMAPSLAWLVVFRIIQGAAGGGLQPVSQAVLADSFPPRERGMAFSIYGVAVVFAPAIGPTLGGWITDNVSWHWIFLLNVPVGIVLTILAWLLVHDTAAYEKARKAKMAAGFTVDYIGLALLTLGLGCLQIMLDKGQDDDWFSSTFITTMAVTSGLSLLALVLWEPFQRHPIMDLSLFRYRNFSIANIMMFMLGFVLFGSTLLIPQFVQQVLGYTATLAGLVISPGGFVIVVMMPIVGMLSGRVDARWMVGIGLSLVSISMFHMTGFDLDSSYTQLVLARCLQTLGLAFIFIPVTSIAYVGVPPDKTDQVSAMVNLTRNIGGSVGISLVTTWLARRGQYHHEVLASSVTPYDHQTQALLHQLTQHFMAAGAAFNEARHQAQATIANLVAEQSQLMSFIDDYWILGIVIACLVPLSLLMSSGKEEH